MGISDEAGRRVFLGDLHADVVGELKVQSGEFRNPAWFSPYGERLALEGGEAPGLLGYQGDPTTQAATASPALVDMTARFYTPELGRFSSLDVEAGRARDPMSLNRSIYGSDSPLTYFDPTGKGGKCPQPTAHCTYNPHRDPEPGGDAEGESDDPSGEAGQDGGEAGDPSSQSNSSSPYEASPVWEVRAQRVLVEEQGTGLHALNTLIETLAMLGIARTGAAEYPGTQGFELSSLDGVFGGTYATSAYIAGDGYRVTVSSFAYTNKTDLAIIYVEHLITTANGSTHWIGPGLDSAEDPSQYLSPNYPGSVYSHGVAVLPMSEGRPMFVATIAQTSARGPLGDYVVPVVVELGEFPEPPGA